MTPRSSLRQARLAGGYGEIPAFAGMTVWGTGMTVWGTGMTPFPNYPLSTIHYPATPD